MPVGPTYVGTLIGSNENGSRFGDVYTGDVYTGPNNFHFRVSILGSDTVVDCPAYILAKLIDLYEN